MNAKQISAMLIGCSLNTFTAFAQLKTSDNSFFISPGTTVTVSALSLTPTEPTNLNNNEINHSALPVAGKPTGSINRVYQLANPLSFKGKMLITYLDGELNGNAEDLLQMAVAGSNLVYQIPTDKSTVDKILNNVHETRDWSSVSFITATSSGSALPVTLVDFVISSRENDVALAWSTSYEANSDFFEIQYSVDGKTWISLGEVKSNGESKIEQTYAYVHEHPLEGDHYYRLRMVDNDGSFAYSRIRHIQIKNDFAIAFHPNPVVDWLTIDVSKASQLSNMKIVNKSGKIVYEANNGDLETLKENVINVKNLSTGIYVIQVRDKDGTMHSSKFVKN
ncbi:T9SS type A sorting domain-containing protein [Dyadobacter sp. CY326]|uniref:T9SS type A sorting domain-containing protein n=1 Tax=Dyadobacter sp. CY326 TaxID=2907300 RepID=UPI001F388CB3|nr:T9SS type A sorting domain-containing protein [Dyadobacter sp. CY326]MCE7066610.1 T9SS type A sorting domain-containing protein [Dyadobacter sp. CY326]